MKLQFLGTAAAEGIPSLFCHCETCKKARERGGRELRSRSQAIVNDRLLIDFPCDAFYHFTLFGIDSSQLRKLHRYTRSRGSHFSVGIESHPPREFGASRWKRRLSSVRK
ncbi:MAG: hypothetical protein IKC59_02145 [Clostridia bacterium]|nr:hypothetical protein [Clostridia bacterium]